MKILLGNKCIGEMENREAKVHTPANKDEPSDIPQKVRRRPIKVAFYDSSQRDERYGGSGDIVILEGELLKPKKSKSDTVVIFIHPSGILNLLPLPNALASSGIHVITCCSRYPNNDTCLIMEKVLLDISAVVEYARSTLSYKTVVLAGWSGGGSLLAYYQSQAENPTVTSTPAGDSIELQDLAAADGLLLLAAHKSRATIFTEWLDPSVMDENDPSNRISKFDIYSSSFDRQSVDNKFQQEFFLAQLARNRRITRFCINKLAEMEAKIKLGNVQGTYERNKRDEVFVVHCTQSDLSRFTSNEALEELSRENHSAVGLGRVTTLRAFLSQWSYDLSNADGPASLRNISVPVLVLANEKDHLVPLSHPQALYHSIPHTNKSYTMIKNATHYYFGQPDCLSSACSEIESFLKNYGLLQNKAKL